MIYYLARYSCQGNSKCPLGSMKVQSLVVFSCNLLVTCVLIGHRWSPSWLRSPAANVLETDHPQIPRPLKQIQLFACSATSAVQMTRLHHPSDTWQNCMVSGPEKKMFISLVGKAVTVIAFHQTIPRFGVLQCPLMVLLLAFLIQLYELKAIYWVTNNNFATMYFEQQMPVVNFRITPEISIVQT